MLMLLACCNAGMSIRNEETALKAIRNNARDQEERTQMFLLFKGLSIIEREDLWHGLTPDDLVDVLRARLLSGGYVMQP